MIFFSLFYLEKTCVKVCPRIYRPVCGSDGSTYSNTCMMEVAACITNEDISVEHEGKCGMLKCIACLTQLTIAKMIAACRFYRVPLRA